MKHSTPSSSLSSGFPALDAALPLAGWPVGALTEILVPRVGHGELNLLGPLLSRLTKAGRTVALLVPPYLSYAPALIQHDVALECVKLVRTDHPLDGLEQLETAVRAGEFAAFVAILPSDQAAAQSESTVRRLYMAAKLSACPAFLFHTCSTPATTSASQLRLLADMSQPGQIRLQRIAPTVENSEGAVTLDISQHAARAGFKRMAGLAVSASNTRATEDAGLPDTEAENTSTPRPAAPRVGHHAPHTKPAPSSRSPWPFKQRRGAGSSRSGYPAALALLFSRGWNA
ncbi:hypothetical protein [Pigmentiphaga sp.]|uniref:hypothetical protein n=1 Tax=Pigmentiphaga sp. TaxID=1977564 RepID=UPI00128CAE48|nr:hypothetical protein [Pigmentiphaga sp.]MPS28569.1 hypothetical protein [Alcaligenaceae bacterium SAGV5]MPS52316.1 hypothetical protein [Alcaligenaceae bacterium SAGV3]MPT57570.1 hypothetical protein [Alcaligenaceae bacterium]